MLGKQIKKLRSSLGMSQAAFADELFVSRQVISNYERDLRVPDLAFLLRLTERFEIDLTTLIQESHGSSVLSQEKVNYLYWEGFMQLLVHEKVRPTQTAIHQWASQQEPVLAQRPLDDNHHFWRRLMEETKGRIDRDLVATTAGQNRVRDVFLPVVCGHGRLLQFFYLEHELEPEWSQFIGQACQQWASFCLPANQGELAQRWQLLFLTALLETLLANWFGGTYLATLKEVQGLYDHLATLTLTELMVGTVGTNEDD